MKRGKTKQIESVQRRISHDINYSSLKEEAMFKEIETVGTANIRIPKPKSKFAPN